MDVTKHVAYELIFKDNLRNSYHGRLLVEWCSGVVVLGIYEMYGVGTPVGGPHHLIY